MYHYIGIFVLGVVFGGSFEHYRLTAEINDMIATQNKERAELAEKILQQKEHISAMSDQIALVYTQKQTKSETKYRTITKEIDRVVKADPNSNCLITNDWVHIYNEAIQPSH